MMKFDRQSYSAQHKNNLHRDGYDFDRLTKNHPDLRAFIIQNKAGNSSIPFADPAAVKALNTALLKTHYDIAFWDLSDDYLCPAVPGRANYVHHLSDLIGADKSGRILDIGTGANLIYPIIGTHVFNWSFVAVDADEDALAHAQDIIDNNDRLMNKIELRYQSSSDYIFNGIIKNDERFDAVICNPPFHASKAEADAANKRKVKNLSGKGSRKSNRNFNGRQNELWYPGGEISFISKMIKESVTVQSQIRWVTTLVSKQSSMPQLLQYVKQQNPDLIRVIEMNYGNKKSRILCWRY